MRITVPFGTRPEIVKLAPVVRELQRRGHQVRVVATGQHDQPEMSDVLLDELGLRPDVRLTLPADAHQRLGALLTSASDLLAGGSDITDLVLVLGDTFTVPLWALAARRAGVPVAHVEAGLRSWNPTSMEEVNRKVGAACASLHFAPTTMAAAFLHAEGVPAARVTVVGNPVIDALVSAEVAPVPPAQRTGVVVTAHRATNVDDPARLRRLVELVATLGRAHPPVLFPVHPRTADRLDRIGLADLLRGSPGVVVADPLPYRAMLLEMARAQVVVTDSGGVQEEVSWLGVPVVVLRRTTPRWEGVVAGTSALVGLDVGRALAAVDDFCRPERQDQVAAAPCPYGDGSAARRIADVLDNPATADLLALREPDLDGLPAAVLAAAAAAAGLGPVAGARPAAGPRPGRGVPLTD